MSYKEKLFELFGSDKNGNVCSGPISDGKAKSQLSPYHFILSDVNQTYCSSILGDELEIDDDKEPLYTQILNNYMASSLPKINIYADLKNLYKIAAKDDAFSWAMFQQNKYGVYRVLDYIWGFHSYDHAFINISVTQFYVYFTNKYWMDHIYENIKNTIRFDEKKNKITFIKSSKEPAKDSADSKNNKNNVIEHISTNYIIERNMFIILTKFVEHNKSNKTNGKIHEKMIPDFISSYLHKL